MKILSIGGLTSLAVLAAAAVPAQATVTPVNSSVTASNSSLALWTEESTGTRIICQRSDFTGRTSADGRSFSGTITFSSSSGGPCFDNVLGLNYAWACRGNLTWRSSSSVARTSASGTWAFDSGFECTIRPTAGSVRQIRGPQVPTNCTWTFIPPSTLGTRCSTIADDSRQEYGLVTTYAFRERLTVS